MVLLGLALELDYFFYQKVAFKLLFWLFSAPNNQILPKSEIGGGGCLLEFQDLDI